MSSEIAIVVAATSQEWARRLTSWVTDHGGDVRLRDHYVFTRTDALEQEYDCFVGDADSSLMEARLVHELHRRDRAVVGVCDPTLPHTQARLHQLGVDRVVQSGASPDELLGAIVEVARDRRRFAAVVDGLDRFDAGVGEDVGQAASDEQPVAAPTSCVTVVTGPTEGVGATEVAVELAVQLRLRGEPTVLVDADLVAPALAQRLRVALTPNLHTAIDAVQRMSGAVDEALVGVRAGGFDLLGGLEHPKHWADLVPDEVCDVITELRHSRRQVLVNVGSQVEDLPVATTRRHGVARALLTAADRVVVVAEPSPVGLQRLCRWVGDAAEVTDVARMHVVMNRAGPADTRRQAETEVLRVFTPAGIWHLPADPRVPRAGWACELVRGGPFTKAVRALADAAVPRVSGSANGARRLAWKGRR